MVKSPERTYDSRIQTLKRRRDFLDKRVADYQGKDMSRDLAEASAIDWALAIIEAHYEFAIDHITTHKPPKPKDKSK